MTSAPHARPVASPPSATEPAPTWHAAAWATVGAGVLLTAALVVLHFRFQRHAGALWRDEVNSVNIATLPSFGEVFAQVPFDSFPAAWLTVLHAWSALGLGGSDAGFRRLGLLTGLATIAVAWWTGRRLRLGAPLVTLLLLGMSPTTIIYGDEVRGYGLAVLAVVWSLGATWSFVDHPTWGRFAVAQAAAVLAAQAHFANGFLLLAIVGGAATVGLRRRAWRTLAAVVGVGAVAAVSLLLDLPAMRYSRTLWPVVQGDFGLAWFADTFWHGLAPGVPLLTALWPLAVALAVAGFALGWRADEADADRARVAAATLGLGLVSYAVCLQLVAKLRTEFWYYLPLMALIAITCDVGVDLLVRRLRHGAWMRIAAVLTVAALAMPRVAGTVAVRMTNLDLVAAKVAEAAGPDDLVVVFPWYAGITFQRYYRGTAPWVTLPDFDEHRIHRHLLVVEKMKLGDAAIAPELARVERTLQGGHRVWVVGEPVAPPPGEPPPRLAPAPTGPEGWRVDVYLEAWPRQLGALVQQHARRADGVALPDVGAVNRWEFLPLTVVEGWR